MRILIIEEEWEIASFIKKGLSAERFVVDTADSGEEGIKLAKLNQYDLAIIDINLPKIDGIEVCKNLREDKKTFPIIMLRVKNESETKIQVLNTGADDYLSSPFSFEELLAIVRALLRRQKKIIGPKLKVDNLEMDILSHTVTRAGKPIELSRKEFTLLEYLMRNDGLALTRNMILEHVWDMNADPFTNTVDVHVKFLRDKIDKGHKKKLLHTIRGYGYKME